MKISTIFFLNLVPENILRNISEYFHPAWLRSISNKHILEFRTGKMNTRLTRFKARCHQASSPQLLFSTFFIFIISSLFRFIFLF